MVKRTLRYLWSLRHQFTKYFVVGFSGFFLDMGFLMLFKEVFGLIPVVAVICNQAIVLGYNFTLNKYWSFQNHLRPHRQLARYLTLAAWNYVFAVVTMYGFNQILGFDYRLVRIGTIIVAVSWNFILYKTWVYKTVESPKS